MDGMRSKTQATLALEGRGEAPDAMVKEIEPSMAAPATESPARAELMEEVTSWYREGKDVQSLLPALATYLGHVKITSTQVYLRATAELLEEANERFLKNFRQNVLKKGQN